MRADMSEYKQLIDFIHNLKREKHSKNIEATKLTRQRTDSEPPFGLFLLTILSFFLEEVTYFYLHIDGGAFFQ